jgi:hypothetical protein
VTFYAEVVGMESQDHFFFLVWFLFLYLEGRNASMQYFFSSFFLARCT